MMMRWTRSNMALLGGCPMTSQNAPAAVSRNAIASFALLRPTGAEPLCPAGAGEAN